MAKRVQKPVGFHMDQLLDIYSVSGCINEDFADYIAFWKHNNYWLFDSPEIIRATAQENSIVLAGTSLFFYEVHDQQFDGKSWLPWKAEMSFHTNIIEPTTKSLEGFDVVTFHCGNAPEHSPLSCNALAREISVNNHCLVNSFDDAYSSLSSGKFKYSEPGPYRIFSVYSVPWP